jgi:hypothetical protein
MPPWEGGDRSNDLPAMSKRRLLSFSSQRHLRFLRQPHRVASLALPYLRSPVLRKTCGAPVRAIRALPQVRQFRSPAYRQGTRRKGHLGLPEAHARISRVPLRSLPREILQRLAFSPHPAFDDACRAASSFGRLAAFLSGSPDVPKALASVAHPETYFPDVRGEI